MAAAPAEKRHDFEFVKPLYDHLTAVGAVGEATPLLPHLKLGNDARLTLVRKNASSAGWASRPQGRRALLWARRRLNGVAQRPAIGSLEPLRGLPIDSLDLTAAD